MSNPMLSAIKARKAGQVDSGHKPEMVHSGDHTQDLHQFVKQLPPEAKEKLHAMLSQDMSSSEQINKGGPSKEEQGKIQERSQQEDAREALEQDGTDAEPDSDGVDSDKIALDMLDSRFKNSQPAKPRNLHERVQTSMAHNLKAKGKI